MCETMGESYLHNYIERSIPEFIRHDVYLDKLADKILEKFGPEASIVVGGAAINYTFSRASAYLDVAKECSLPTDWMNHNGYWIVHSGYCAVCKTL